MRKASRAATPFRTRCGSTIRRAPGSSTRCSRTPRRRRRRRRRAAEREAGTGPAARRPGPLLLRDREAPVEPFADADRVVAEVALALGPVRVRVLGEARDRVPG